MNQYKMTIQEAKEEIANTLHIYLQRNHLSQYEIPVAKQRPVLLMGPPGIGKTAIMEQIAQEENVALVSYTITHHTRQSAVGLPVIREREYDGQTFSVTEYTMSEIIASVYDKMEQTGLSEGILFLDEINCVSETLAPTMLQFLQYKTFGSHRIPDGWMIVAAGNPPEYNKSVRDFDIVTLDRLKRIDITEDFPAWKEYAYAHGVHPAILSYLEIKKENFYQVDATIDGEDFVTARGWEDLSRFLLSCEKNSLPVTTATLHQYLQHEEIARDFGNYYELFKKYRQSYDVVGILEGNESPETLSRLTSASFDEALSVLKLFLGRLSEMFALTHQQDGTLTIIFESLQHWRGLLASSGKTARELLQEEVERLAGQQSAMKAAGQLSEERERQFLAAREFLQKGLTQLHTPEQPQTTGQTEDETAFLQIKELFEQETAAYETLADDTRNALTNAFLFLEKAFAGRQEMVLFVTELTLNAHGTWFVSEHGCDKFYEYNKELLLEERKKELKERIRHLI